jgi:hypothetical protein
MVAVAGRERIWIALALALLGPLVVFGFSGRVADGRLLVSGDAHYVWLAARSLAFDGDLDLGNQYLALGDRWGLGRSPAADGWRFPPREIGPSLLMVPGLWLHHTLGLPRALETSFAVLPASLAVGAVFWQCEGIVAALPGTRRVAPRAAALAAALAFVVPYYAMGPVGYAHAPDAVVCAGLCSALIRGSSPRVIGGWLALSVLFRLQNFLWLAWPLLGSVGRPRAFRTAVPALLVVAGLGTLGLVPQAWLAVAHPGSESGAIRWGADFFDLDGWWRDVGVVLAGGHGLLTFTPIAALAVGGLVAGVRAPEARSVALPALAILAAMVALVATVRDPGGGWAFGARRFAGCAALVAIGVALALDRLSAGVGGRWRTLGVPALWILPAVGNLALTGLALTGRLPLAPDD